MSKKTEQAKARLLGKIFKTKRGGDCVVVDYKAANHIVVRFENGSERVVQYGALLLGNVKNYEKPLVQGFGITDLNTTGDRFERLYRLWNNVLKRCFNEKVKEKYPTYRDVTCCERWKRFSNFVADVEEIENVEKGLFDGWHFDKDVLSKGNKFYSKDTCCFIPKEINKLFTKREAKRGLNPLGVYYNKKLNKYTASCHLWEGQKHLGAYETQGEAFLAYKTAKEKHIKEVANKWRGLIGENVYLSMLDYKVDIDD